jgi:hypothetical protein
MTREITISRSAVADCAGAPRPVALISYSSCLACLRSCTYSSSRSKLSFQNRDGDVVLDARLGAVLVGDVAGSSKYARNPDVRP